MDPVVIPEWITFEELYKTFRVSRSTGNRLVAAGLIDARKLGRRVLIRADSVREHLNRQKRPAITPDDRSDRLLAKSLATI
jgi:excisionase family DNA binding protein